jgi:hypothetical protein
MTQNILNELDEIPLELPKELDIVYWANQGVTIDHLYTAHVAHINPPENEEQTIERTIISETIDDPNTSYPFKRKHIPQNTLETGEIYELRVDTAEGPQRIYHYIYRIDTEPTPPGSPDAILPAFWLDRDLESLIERVSPPREDFA